MTDPAKSLRDVIVQEAKPEGPSTTLEERRGDKAQSKNSPTLAAAVDLANRGWSVFPVRGKIPWIPKEQGGRGCLDATQDVKMIEGWWGRWPSAGIGLATGAPSGVWVLDVDGQDGERALRALEREHGDLPSTVEALTPRGRHLYWRLPPQVDLRCSASRVASGIDVRGTGGYVVAPPSRHPDGGWYAWEVTGHPEDQDVADAPPWLLELVTTPPATNGVAPPVAMEQVIHSGQRNASLTSLAGTMRRRGMEAPAIEALRTEMRVELIQELIPLGLAEVGRVLDEEVERLAGPRHARKGEGEVIYRHGSNPGSVRLGGQRHPVRVPRVRGLEGEARLESYERLHWAAGEVDEGLFRKVLLGISCRDYEAAVEAVPGAIGLSKSTVSREFKKATARQRKAFQERELTELDVVALFLDGKTFTNDEIVVALAVTMGGDKVFAGFVQTETENARVITSFLRSLKDRGLDLSAGALVVIDGAKGLKSAVTTVFRGQVLIQRCQWHKRENVVSYLPRTEQKAWRGRLQRAYERPTYAEAKRDLKAMRAELDELNQSAVASLDEGFEETLTLHRLGVFPLVGRSLKTTNVLESVNAQAEQRCGRVDRWRNSNHKQRWLAAALIDIEPRLRRLLGYRHLPSLRAAIQKELGIIHPDSQTHAAA